MYIPTIRYYSTLKSWNIHSAARQVIVMTMTKRSDLNPTGSSYSLYGKISLEIEVPHKYQFHKKYIF